MTRFRFFAVVLAIGALAGPVSAANITPSATISSTPDGADFDYTITLTNSSSSSASIGTFWYAWIPGQDYLATSPISETNPTGWSPEITNMGAGDGFAILWQSSSSSDNVPIGGSLTFGFKSADTPAQVNGDSQFFPGTPVGTSYVYPVGPFSDGGHVFAVSEAVSAVPEPSTLTLGIVAFLSSAAYLRFRRHKTA